MGVEMDKKPGLFLVVFIDKKDPSKDQFIKRLEGWLNEEFSGYTMKLVDSGSKNAGRGAVLKKLWPGADDEILAYIDANSISDFTVIKDVSISLSEHYDIVCGSRFLAQSNGKRPFFRRWLSSSYNFLIRKMFRIRNCTDAQCHLKALKKEAAQQLIPKIKSNKSFFDTELMVLGQISGLKIRELPVSFVEPAEKAVDIFGYLTENIVNLIRLKRSL